MSIEVEQVGGFTINLYIATALMIENFEDVNKLIRDFLSSTDVPQGMWMLSKAFMKSIKFMGKWSLGLDTLLDKVV